MNLCDYGCGQEGKYQLKNGKWSCKKDWNKCPNIRLKRSQNHKGVPKGHKWETKNCVHCNKPISIQNYSTHVDVCKYKRSNINLYCEYCNVKHNGYYGSGRFCSCKCARGFSTKLKREDISKNVSNKLKGKGHGNIKIKCNNCFKNFTVNWFQRKRKYCSIKCACVVNKKKMKLRNREFKTAYEKYKLECQFNFSLDTYPDEYNFNLINEYGWYKAKNRGDNLGGVSRDHMISVKYGFEHKINPKIISHPANCK